MLFLVPHFLIYFLLQKFFAHHEHDLLTSLDKKIPLIPEFVWVYHSLLPVLVGVVVFLLKTKRNFFEVYVACLFATLCLTAFYILVPCFYPREALPNDNTVSTWLVEMTRIVDDANNVFPSSHVTFSWIVFFGVNELRRSKLFFFSFFIWAVMVSVSTLFLKQHYLLDVFTGMFLAYCCFYFSKNIVGWYLSSFKPNYLTFLGEKR